MTIVHITLSLLSGEIFAAYPGMNRSIRIYYWKNAEFFDVNVERSRDVCCALKDSVFHDPILL